MRVLVDANIVLDVLLAREPFAAASGRVFALAEQSRIEGVLCATTFTTMDYLLKRNLPRVAAHQALHKLVELFDIAPVNRAVLSEALAGRIPDFEDAVQYQAARLSGAEAIVTRNQKDFRLASILVLGPDELLRRF